MSADRDAIIDLTDEVERLQARLARLDRLIAVDDPLSLADVADPDAQRLYQFATRAVRCRDHYRRATATGDHCAFCGEAWPCTVAQRGVR